MGERKDLTEITFGSFPVRENQIEKNCLQGGRKCVNKIEIHFGVQREGLVWFDSEFLLPLAYSKILVRKFPHITTLQARLLFYCL
jgi:hypothetical protein